MYEECFGDSGMVFSTNVGLSRSIDSVEKELGSKSNCECEGAEASKLTEDDGKGPRSPLASIG